MILYHAGVFQRGFFLGFSNRKLSWVGRAQVVHVNDPKSSSNEARMLESLLFLDGSLRTVVDKYSTGVFWRDFTQNEFGSFAEIHLRCQDCFASRKKEASGRSVIISDFRSFFVAENYGPKRHLLFHSTASAISASSDWRGTDGISVKKPPWLQLRKLRKTLSWSAFVSFPNKKCSEIS